MKGGIADYIYLVLHYLIERVCKVTEHTHPTYETYLELFGEKRDAMKYELEQIISGFCVEYFFTDSTQY